MHPEHIVLMQHDGFASTTQLDSKAIEAAVTEATGYHLALECEQILLDPDAQFLKGRIKNGIDRRANAGAGFRDLLVS